MKVSCVNVINKKEKHWRGKNDSSQYKIWFLYRQIYVYCTAKDHLLQTSKAISILPLHYLLIFILSIKGTLLFTLLARDRRSIAFFGICTPLAFATDKCSNGITVLASRWLSIGLYILLTLFTYSACVTLSGNKYSFIYSIFLDNFYESRNSLFLHLHGLLEFWSAICTFYYGKGSPAFLYKQQILLNIISNITMFLFYLISLWFLS